MASLCHYELAECFERLITVTFVLLGLYATALVAVGPVPAAGTGDQRNDLHPQPYFSILHCKRQTMTILVDKWTSFRAKFGQI